MFTVISGTSTDTNTDTGIGPPLNIFLLSHDHHIMTLICIRGICWISLHWLHYLLFLPQPCYPLWSLISPHTTATTANHNIILICQIWEACNFSNSGNDMARHGSNDILIGELWWKESLANITIEPWPNHQTNLKQECWVRVCQTFNDIKVFWYMYSSVNLSVCCKLTNWICYYIYKFAINKPLRYVVCTSSP